MTITRVNPDTMYKSPAFSQMIVVAPAARLIFVGGQNAVDATGAIVGHDLATQTEQALRNVQTALEAAGATLRDIVKMTIMVAPGHSFQDGYAAVRKFPDLLACPPTISAMQVAGLAHPDFLIEIEAIAAVSAGETG